MAQSPLFKSFAGPRPFDDFRFIDAVFVRVVAAGDLLVPELVLGMSAGHLEFGYPINRIDGNTGRFDCGSPAQMVCCACSDSRLNRAA